jgi:hypothetical protein
MTVAIPDDRDAEVLTGTETEPGVWREDDGRLAAWDYDPAGDPDPITVTESDVPH